MACDPWWKENNAALIISYSMKRNNPHKVEFYIRAGKIVVEKVSGEFIGETLTVEEVQEVVTNNVNPHLWWCRAAAKKIKLNPQFMDWFYYKNFLGEENS